MDEYPGAAVSASATDATTPDATVQGVPFFVCLQVFFLVSYHESFCGAGGFRLQALEPKHILAT